MGYKKIPTIYTLDSIPGEDGFIVRMRAIQIGKLRRLMRATSTAKSSEAEADQATEEMFRLMAEGLVSWNLEDENGVPVPADSSGLDAQELPLILKVVEAWLSQMTGPEPELGKGSLSGGSFPGQPLMTEAL